MTRVKGTTALGLMSGTSADGVTAVMARFSARGLRVLQERTFPYPAAIRAKVLAAAELKTPELSRLNVELGELFAKAARAAMARGPKPAVIGSHGQTVWHAPEDGPGHTLQLAEPAVIAERTGVPVVADFRPGDIAAGGQGAPLIPAFDVFLFGRGPWKAAQNIGGIANVSVIGKGRLAMGFDTGPGNCLLDLAVRQATGQPMDRGGRLAAAGRPDAAVLARMLRLPYFHRRPPKSLERTYFGASFLRKHFGRVTRRALPDVLATLSLLTARSIALSYRLHVFPKHRPSEVIVSGGGALNAHLMRLLRRELAPIPVTTSADHGIPVMAKEAACFAWMAVQALAGKPNNCPAATASRGPRVLGKLIRPTQETARGTRRGT